MLREPQILNPRRMAAEHRLLLLLFLILVAGVVTWAQALPAPGSGNSTTEFIRTSCMATHYPNLCFNSLARYAGAVRKDPVQLARAATNVTLGRLRSVRAHVWSLRRSSPPGAHRWESAALRDCAQVLGDAAELGRQTAAELGRLETAVGPEVKWRVSNAQTWLSSAMTYEDTCADGFDRSVPDPMKADVRRVKELSSPATLSPSSAISSPGSSRKYKNVYSNVYRYRP